ncbi:hypothetical protein DID80_06210 [Candidatus Marinamargulisbacteria bacterium SCGC AAA071-K20]|nr:hypothetical protein DID80_06210 [Candidatus Marinamargulisbacteria bacterium SCGC AAA071-K20]
MNKRLLISLFLGAVFIGILTFLNSQVLLLKNISYHNRVFTSEANLEAITHSFQNRSLMYARLRLPFLFLKQNPKINSLNFKINWPDSLEITLNEKEPWLSFFVENNTLIISRDGTILSRGQESIANSDQLTIIRGIDSSYFQSHTLKLDALSDILTLIDTLYVYLPDLDVQVEKTVGNHWMLLKDDIMPIYFGSLDRLDEKCELLKSYLTTYSNQTRKKTINYIDLRVRSKCIVAYE